jgi:hypothetical protein
MAFGTAIRIVADATQPTWRRRFNLVSAVEQFGMFGGYWDTFAQLHATTGSAPGLWSSDQLDVAAELLAAAHVSWNSFQAEAQMAARIAKRQPGYKATDRCTLLSQWRQSFLTDDVRKQWKIPDDQEQRLKRRG